MLSRDGKFSLQKQNKTKKQPAIHGPRREINLKNVQHTKVYCNLPETTNNCCLPQRPHNKSKELYTKKNSIPHVAECAVPFQLMPVLFL